MSKIIQQGGVSIVVELLSEPSTLCSVATSVKGLEDHPLREAAAAHVYEGVHAGIAMHAKPIPDPGLQFEVTLIDLPSAPNALAYLQILVAAGVALELVDRMP